MEFRKKQTLQVLYRQSHLKTSKGVPVANTATLLQGRMTGVNITMNGAQAGNDNPEIRVRGVGTFGNSNPMVLIDGVEGTLSQLSDISPADIENISILKMPHLPLYMVYVQQMA